jgi:uncharacterized membrane protein
VSIGAEISTRAQTITATNGRNKMIIGLALHTLAAVIWVGGMFFAHMIVRPAVLPLDPARRFQLWRHTFLRFFRWVWLCIAVLLVSGFAMVIFGQGGFRAAGLYVHIMAGLGVVMSANFLFLYFVLWPRFRQEVDAENWQLAPLRLIAIRRLVTANLVLGLATVAIAAGGRYFG